MAGKAASNAQGVREVAKVPGSVERGSGRHHDRGGADYDDECPDYSVGLLVFEPPRGDAFVDDVGLLEKELPGSDSRADDRDDQQRSVGGESALDAGDQEAMKNRSPVRVAEQGQWKDEQAGEDEDEHRALPATEIPGHRDGDEDQGCKRHNKKATESEVFRRERHSDELGADGQEAQKEQAANGIPAPELAEPLGDQPRVANASDRPEADDHLLVDDEDRHQEDERPEQRVPVVLARLRIRRDPAGVVVADHDDERGAHDRRKREAPPPPW